MRTGEGSDGDTEYYDYPEGHVQAKTNLYSYSLRPRERGL